jgi:hypothetical protein
MNRNFKLMPQVKTLSVIKSKKANSLNLKLHLALVKSTGNDMSVEENDVLSQPLFQQLMEEASRRHISPLTLLNHIVQKHMLTTKQGQNRKAHG